MSEDNEIKRKHSSPEKNKRSRSNSESEESFEQAIYLPNDVNENKNVIDPSEFEPIDFSSLKNTNRKLFLPN